MNIKDLARHCSLFTESAHRALNRKSVIGYCLLIGFCATQAAIGSSMQNAENMLETASAEQLKEDQRQLRPLDLFELQWASDPRISPDGERVVYVRKGFDILTDQPTSRLWIIDSDGRNHQPISPAGTNESTPRWSPDGDRLAYVSGQEKTPQIHVRWMNTGANTAITNLTAATSNLSWSPDGKYLAFNMHVPAKRKPIAVMPVKPKGAKWAPEAMVLAESYYRADGRGYAKEGQSQLFIVSAEGGSPRQLTFEPYPHSSNPSWSPSGERIYYAANYSEDWQLDLRESEIYAVELADGRITRITQRRGPDTSPQVSPNGKMLAYLGYDEIGKYQVSQLYVMDIAENKSRSLTANLDRDVSALYWSKNSKAVYIRSVDQAVTKVDRVDLNGKIEAVTSGLGGTSIGRPYSSGTFSVAQNGSIAYEKTASDRPSEVAVSVRGNNRQLTDLNRDLLSHKILASVDEFWYTSSAGKREIQGWIVKPPGFDPTRKYPLILEIHGGPNTSYGNNFSAEIQLYAARGYVVLYTNPRGSTSYGTPFVHEIHHRYPGEDYDDLMSGVDAVIRRGYVDTENLFVTGGSGGGVLTAWIIGKTDRFRAAVSAKPVINWFSHTLTSDIGPIFWKINFSGLPWEEPEKYLALSPIS
jgi:acylaminoacyl-peptidase